MFANRIRFGAGALAVSGILFVIYRHFDRSPTKGRCWRRCLRVWGAGAWLASHMLTVVPFVLLPLGLLRVATLSPCDARRTSAPCLRRLERDWHRL